MSQTQPQAPSTAASSSTGPSSNPRKERGAIAAQACETCRQRKQKCDEARPKCNLCSRMKLECKYREPQPTKKDKTLVEILDRLKSIEEKVNRFPHHPESNPGTHSSVSSQPSIPEPNLSSLSSFSNQQAFFRTSGGELSDRAGMSQPYRHASAAHKMLTWPAIQQMIQRADPTKAPDMIRLIDEGSAFILSLPTSNLPQDEIEPDRPFQGMQMQYSRDRGGPHSTFPSLTFDVMTNLANSYFDTFNVLYPFMDRQTFMSENISKVYSEGFNGDSVSVSALLVFALGELAQAGIEGHPIHTQNGRPSGLRGGTAQRPPGLSLYNAARSKMGFVLTECDLENVQIYSLAALYNQSCSRHVDFWRLTVSASLACQFLVTCNTINWDSERGDMIRRAYWHCAIMETGLHLELELPMVNLLSLEDVVPLPIFSGKISEADRRAEVMTSYRAHWAGQIALRRLCANIHQNINGSMSSEPTPDSGEDFNGPAASTLATLASQLDQWRNMLPWPVRWPDGDPCANPPLNEHIPLVGRTADSYQSTQYGGQHYQRPFFTKDLGAEVAQYPYVYNMQVALLRTRYLYARYMIYRPFIYKALHFPDQITQDDALGVAECLKSCVNWPILTSPPALQKRLVPYLFCWSQNFLGILIIFHMSQEQKVLRDVRQRIAAMDPRFESDVADTTELMLQWIEDLRGCDSIANWCYATLATIYNLKNRR